MSNSRKRPLEEGKAASEKRKAKVTQPQRLHNGLYNQGNTCYLNSVLQVLFMTTDFHERLDPKSKITDKELRKIFEKLKVTTCGTENIAKAFEIKNVNQQSDAAECLELILHKVSPRASKVFQGQRTYTTKCSKDHVINEETNPFWTLPLPLKEIQDSTFSVEGGFQSIFQTKTFNGDNMVYCNECKKKRDATSGCEMTEFPRNLILLLKRFDFDYNTMSHFKSDCCVEVPCELQLKNKKYKLYGMVNHTGGLRGGHNTATILSKEDDTWYEFDDAHVRKVKEQPFAQTRTHNSCTAYLLLYRASRSQRDEGRERQDETGHLDQQTGHKVEHKRRFRESAGDKENRQAQESQEQMRKERNKESFSHHYRGEGGHPEHEKKVSSFTRDQHRAPAEEDVFLLKKQTTAYSSKQHPDSRTKPDKRIQMSKKEEDVNSAQPCASPADILKNPLVIGLIVVGVVVVALIVILPITLSTPN